MLLVPFSMIKETLHKQGTKMPSRPKQINIIFKELPQASKTNLRPIKTGPICVLQVPTCKSQAALPFKDP